MTSEIQQQQPEKPLATTAIRIKALAKTLDDEAFEAQRNNQLVTNGPRKKFIRWFRAGGFKQNVEKPLSLEDKRLVEASSVLNKLANLVSADSAEETGDNRLLLIPDVDPTRVLQVKEDNGTVEVVISGSGPQADTFTISRDGVLFQNPPVQQSGERSQPRYDASPLQHELARFTPRQAN